jgi:hypothetical protein
VRTSTSVDKANIDVDVKPKESTTDVKQSVGPELENMRMRGVKLDERCGWVGWLEFRRFFGWLTHLKEWPNAKTR